MADGRASVSAQTLLRQINDLYKKVGFDSSITAKSAKVLGVSTAFFLGLSDDQIRILGRWKDISTSQYYRSVDHSTLLSIFSRLSLFPEKKDDFSCTSNFSDRLVGLPSCCKSVISEAYHTHSCQSSSNTSNIHPIDSSQTSTQSSTLTWLVNTGWTWPSVSLQPTVSA